MKVIHLIAGARPNFMKIGPLYHQLVGESWAKPVVVHTGQHYDENMSQIFFDTFALPEPDFSLGVGSGTHAVQTAQVMVEYEKVCLEEKPDLVIVVGDVNSTIACALVASKLHIPIAHLEAGLRSFDRAMPEEVNRVLTDSISDILWTPSLDGDQNLKNEGVPEYRIQFVGNIMIDSLERMREQFVDAGVHEEFNLPKQGYGLLTLHRPSNVDNVERLCEMVRSLAAISKSLPLVFPIHPRTRERINNSAASVLVKGAKDLHLVDPLGYVEFMSLLSDSRLVVTDSGGIQEETTYLGVPCLTVRPNTERPITITMGTNRLTEIEELESAVEEVLSEPARQVREMPPLWDGLTASRVTDSIHAFMLGEDSQLVGVRALA